jgi:hypothetical protein
MDRIISGLERLAGLLERLLLRQGEGYGPFLNAGFNLQVSGPEAKPVRLYQARKQAALLIIQTQASGAAGDLLILSPENGSFGSAFRVEVGSEDRTFTLRVAAYQDIYAVSQLAGGGTLSINVIETA